MNQLTDDSKAADIAMSSPLNGEGDAPIKRAIEVGFPIVEINRLAVPERYSYKPVYQMHKWFARRASCVFRAILLGALKPSVQPDGAPTDIMAEFYKQHADDPDTKDKVVLDPFMGGGTTIVEALRLGCHGVGIDLNPVAWFIVKTETEPVDPDALKAAFDRLAARPVAWNGGRTLKETLLHLYKTDITSGLEADVVYTFWVKSAVCTDINCRREIPLFKDYIIAQKPVKIPYHRDAICPACRKTFDWETKFASLIAEPALMANAPRGSGGDGRPTTLWSYAAEPSNLRRRGDLQQTDVHCPHCNKLVRMQVPSAPKQRKSISLSVLLCPECEIVWQWRGPPPDREVNCPSCRFSYDPRKGTVVEESLASKRTLFQCRCGQKDQVVASLRTLPKHQRLPIRPYAVQCYLAPDLDARRANNSCQPTFFENTVRSTNDQDISVHDTLQASGLQLPNTGRFFKRITVADTRRLQYVDAQWQQCLNTLPYPKSAIRPGAETNRLLEHHYNSWSEMFNPRQLLALSTLLHGIMAEDTQALKETLLCAFSNTLEANNLFTRHRASRSKPGSLTAEGVFARHDFQPKATVAENNVFGLPGIGAGSILAEFGLLVDGVSFQQESWDWRATDKAVAREKVKIDPISNGNADLVCKDSATAELLSCDAVITDPPYVGNVNYAELADFFYVWLRLALNDRYLEFAPEYTPKKEEIVENKVRGKTREDFFVDLLTSFKSMHSRLVDNGVMAFTFHHTDRKGLVWEGLLRSLCESGFELVAVYPIHGDAEASLHLQNKENISYDLVHVCRKRREDPQQRSWAGIRQDVRRRAREELVAIEKGRYGNQGLSDPDVRLICIGKCLELYSAHYGKVLDHDNKPLPLHKALQDISAIVDQLVTKDRPLPSELEAVDGVSYVWLRVLAPIRNEVMMDAISKSARSMQISVDDLKDAGLVVRGRTGRGRTYEVKQPTQRLGELLAKYQPGLKIRITQGELFTAEGQTIFYDIPLVDLVHLVIGLAQAGESVVPWLERFAGLRSQLGAALRYVRDIRADWKDSIDRVLALIEGAPLIRQIEEA